jgi:hypothetical protein
VLEVDMAHEGDTDIPLDVQLMQTLAWIVQEHAAYLSNESHSATSGMRQHPREAAAAYEEAATAAFRAMLRRIEIAARRLRGRQRSPDAEVVNIVTGMLADPWVQRAIS